MENKRDSFFVGLVRLFLLLPLLLAVPVREAVLLELAGCIFNDGGDGAVDVVGVVIGANKASNRF